MIVKNGICYPDVPVRQVKITAAENVGDRIVRVKFDDGETRLFDGRCLEGDVFLPIADAETFAEWKLDYETLTWNDGDIDISPEFVLAHSVKV